MAIIVEEEKKPINWFSLLGGIITIIIIFVGSYYVFFKKPELIESVIPKDYQNLSQISQLSLNTEGVFQSTFFKLPPKQYGSNLTNQTPGRANPFEP